MPANSIKGFKVGNEVKKYDYNELDNLPENDPDDLAEEIGDLKSDLADLNDAFNDDLFTETSAKLEVTQGCWGVANGEPISSSNWCKTDWIKKNAVLMTSSYSMLLLAYNLAGTYIGTWNGATFTTTLDSSQLKKKFAISEFLKQYPSYRFRANFYNDGSALVPSDVISDISVTTDAAEISNDLMNVEKQLNMAYLLNIRGSVLASSGGDIDNGAYKRTDYIPVKSGDTIKYALRTDANYALLTAYNTSKEKVSAIDGTNHFVSGEFTAAQDGYVRLSCINYKLPSASVIFGSSILYGELDKIKSELSACMFDLADMLTTKGTILANGTEYANNSYYRSDYLAVKSGQTYSYSLRANSAYAMITMYDNEKNLLSNYTVVGTDATSSGEFVVPQEGYVRLSCYNVRVIDKSAYFTLKDNRTLYLLNKAQEHDTDIAEINYNLRTVPDYYLTHIQSKTEQIIENMNEVGIDGETAIFITDVHWDTGNTKNSPSLVNYILNHSNVNVLLCGGDIINEGTKATQLALIQSFMDKMKFADIPMPVAFGNHDSNKNAGNPQIDWFDRNTVFSMLMKPASNDVTYISSYDWSFYYEKKATKTWFIFIDTGEEGTIAANAQDSVFNALNYVPDGYHVIIVAHWVYNISDSALTTAGQKIASVVDAYNAKGTITIDGVTYDYTNAHGRCELIVAGHCHNNVQGVTIGGIPYVLTDSDNRARSENVATRPIGSMAEQAFDVITVDYDNHSVKCCRIGAGSDRTFSNGVWS